MKKSFWLLSVCSLLLSAVAMMAFKFPTKEERKISYSEEELFEGIYFREGKVFSLLPELNKNSTVSSLTDSKTLTVHKKIIRELNRRDPQFLSQFKKDVTSGDPVKIESRLFSAQKLLVNIIKSELKNPYGDVTINTALGAQVNPEIFVVVYVFYMPPPPLTDIGTYINNNKASEFEMQSLETESLIFSIAKNLRN
jgi:SdpC family antimicrobial peptide